MDNNDNKEVSGLPITSIFIVLVVLGSIWFYRTPLKGTRPAGSKDVSEITEKVQARLWQDPFAAVAKHKKEHNSDNNDRTSTGNCEKIDEYDNQDKKVIVLGIMVFGGPYAEDAESRLRMRYAALSALGRMEFVPEDSQHIDFFEFEIDGIGDSNKGKHDFTIPFEWFSKSSEKESSQAVLLLWLNDDEFYPDPLPRLSQLIIKVRNGLKEAEKKTDLEFKIFGPAGSTNLVSMMEDLKKNKSKKDKKGKKCFETFKNVKIYSPFSTADDSLLFKAIKDYEAGKDKSVSDYFYNQSNSKINLIRTIGSDKNLCESIIDELTLRKVDVCDSKHHIALISEWDTLYGRSLPQSFIDRVVELRKDKQKEFERECIHKFSYLRGIDGVLPGKSESEPEMQESIVQIKKNKDDKNASAMQRPIGRNQYDYLLRLTKQIHYLNNELKTNRDGRLMAIGILGSDVYDKLLILQAMRQTFPDVIFFTTDLDARLLHPDEFRWARNLIVASYFGLRLHKCIQGEIPAFRDNYQTSLFFSVLLSLNAKDSLFPKGTSPNQKFINTFLLPRIFEVGRRGAYDLTDTDIKPNQDSDGKIHFSLEKEIDITPSKLHPDSDISMKKDRVKICFLVIVSLFALFALFYVSSDTVRKFIESIIKFVKKNILLWVSVLVSVLMILIFCFLFLRQYFFYKLFKEEPFSLFDGVSIWPTEILRVLGGLLSIFFIVYVWFNIKKIHEEMKGAKNSAKRKSEKKKIDLHIEFYLPYYWAIRKMEKLLGSDLWNEYLKLGNFKYCAIRTGIHMGVFFVFSICLKLTLDVLGVDFELFTPARGNVSFFVNRIVLIVAVFSMLFLTFFVVDRHMLYRRYIKLISKQDELMQKSGNFNIENTYKKILQIAEYTERIKYLNVFSFIVLFLMIIARSDYFDKWNMNFTLLTIFLTLGIYSFACTIILYLEAKRYKDGTVEALRKMLVLLKEKNWKIISSKDKNIEKDEFKMERIKLAIDTIGSIRKGAFRPIFQQPLMRAALLPFGGASSLIFIDFLSK